MTASSLPAPTWVRSQIADLSPYVPGLSIEEIRQKYGLAVIIKLASNENPLGTSPLVQERLRRHVANAFRYPQGGNPRLVTALAARHKVTADRVIVGNGSDEIIDLLIRTRAVPGQHNIVCCNPCFSIYPLQATICGVETRQTPLNDDFSFPLERLRALVDENTALVFLTTPDNPSGYCPTADAVRAFAQSLPHGCLLVIDEAYMDFHEDECGTSLLARGEMLPNVAFLRTFSKSFGLAGLRLGYAVMPAALADCLWRARLPFSVNILAEEAGLAALEDTVFYNETLRITREERARLSAELCALGCRVYPSQANFLMFAPPAPHHAADVFEKLLQKGIIVRPLKSYQLPHLLRVSIGNEHENTALLTALNTVLHGVDA